MSSLSRLVSHTNMETFVYNKMFVMVNLSDFAKSLIRNLDMFTGHSLLTQISNTSAYFVTCVM